MKNQRNLFMVLILGALLLVGTLFYFYRRIQKKKGELEKLNSKINEQKDDLENLNHVKDRLFSVISHDLRNPLIALRSYLLMSDNESLNADQKLLFKNQTSQAVSQTGELLDNLLTWANMQIKNTQVAIVPLQLQDCVQDVKAVCYSQAEQKHIHIIDTVVDYIVLADFDILSIALRNLLTNAIKFSKENGRIFISSIQRENKIHLIVRDEGIGIPPHRLQQLLQQQTDSTVRANGEKGSAWVYF